MGAAARWAAQALALLMIVGGAAAQAQERGPNQKTVTRIGQFTPPQAMSGGSVNIDVAVLGEASMPLAGLVLVSAPSGESCVATLTPSSNARLAVGSCSINGLTPGIKAFSADYQGGGGHDGSVSPVLRYAVGPLPTTLDIVVSQPEPVLLGQGFVVSASLGPGVGTPTGTIQFTHASDSCTATLPIPACVFTSNTPGSIGISASYSGDSVFQSSVAPQRNHDVLLPGPVRRLPSTVISGDFSAPDDLTTPTDMTPDGRYLVFESGASNLVPGIDNRRNDVYRYDRLSKEIVRASVRDDGTPTTTGNSFAGRISADGRYVVFVSDANDLVAGDTNSSRDVFRRDLVAGNTVRISVNTLGVQAAGHSDQPDVSDDGDVISFVSAAANLVAGDSNGVQDVFYRVVSAGETHRASVDNLGGEAAQPSFDPVISGDGNAIAFWTENDLVNGDDSNGVADVYLRRILTSQTVLVSRTDLGGNGDAGSHTPSVNRDGKVVAYVSAATNLVSGDNNGVADVFVSFVGGDSQPTQRVSVADNGDEANASSSQPRIAADGFSVVFLSEADNLLPGDSNFAQDLFLRDLAGPMGPGTELINISTSAGFSQIDAANAAVSGDGRLVAFFSFATDLALPANASGPVYLRDRALSQTQSIIRAATGRQPNRGAQSAEVSADGGVVAMATQASNLLAGDNNDALDVYAVGDAVPTQRVSTRDSGAELVSSVDPFVSVSDDGRFVAFASDDTAVVTGVTDQNGSGSDIFVFDRTIGPSSIALISRTATDPNLTADANSYEPHLSADGRYVVFTSNATDLVQPPLSMPQTRVFLHDRDLGTTELVSVNTAGVELNDFAFEPTVSDDGCRIAFVSGATNAGVVFASGNVFMRIRNGCPGGPATLLISQNSGGSAADDNSFLPRIAGSGDAVVFISGADNLDGPLTFEPQAFIRRLPPLVASADTVLVSIAPNALPLDQGVITVDVDASGNRVVVVEASTGLRPSGTTRRSLLGGAGGQAFMRDLVAASTILISLDRFGLPAIAGVFDGRISSDGSKAVLVSNDEQLVVGDNNVVTDVFIVDLPPSGPGGSNCIWDGSVGDWSDPSRWIDCSGGSGSPPGTPGASDQATIGAGSVTLDLPMLAVGHLSMSGGTLTGAEDLLVLQQLDWTGGTLAAPAAGPELRLDSSATATLAGGQKTLNRRNLVLEGVADWTTGLIEMTESILAISPSGRLNSSPGAAVESIFETGSGAQVINDGEIHKLGANVSGIGQGVDYFGAGGIFVQDGRFFVHGDGFFNGSYATDGTAVLEFARSARAFGSAANFLADSTFQFGDTTGTFVANIIDGCFHPSSVVLVFDSALQLQCPSQTSLAVLHLLRPNAAITGANTLTVTGQLLWQAGTMFGSGSEQFVLDAGAVGTFGDLAGVGNNRILFGRDFINHGTITWSGHNDTVLTSGSTFTNASDGAVIVSLLGTAPGFIPEWITGTSGQLLNQGLYQVGSAPEHNIGVDFANAGSVQLSSGSTYLSGPGTDSGLYVVDSVSAELVLRNAAARTITSTGSVSGVGALVISETATLQLQGTLSIGALSLESGSLHLDTLSPAQVGEFDLQGGLLLGDQELEVSVGLNWTSGGIGATGAAPGPVRLLPGSDSTINAIMPVLLRGRALQLAGDLLHSNGEITVPAGESGVIDIGPTGSWVFNSPSGTLGMRCQTMACNASVSNAGLMSQIGAAIPDLALTSPLSLTGGVLHVPGAGLSVSGIDVTSGIVDVQTGAILTTALLQLDPGELIGSGTVVGDVINASGTLLPGGIAVTGQLTIVGDYTQGADGALSIEVAGPAPGSGYDLLSVAGSVSLAGLLNVIDDGYQPSDPEVLTLIAASSGISGTFASVSNPYSGYTVSYGSNDVALVPSASGAAIVVNSVLDPGTGVCDVAECTLREAIDLANATPGPDVIEFDIPAPQCTGPAGSCVITPLTALPAITEGVRIDGYTQSGAVANSQPMSAGLGSNAELRIELDGSSAGGTGLVLDAAAGTFVEVLGLALHGWDTAIRTQGPAETFYAIEGNYIGLRADASVSATPQAVGVSVQGGLLSIGGGAPVATNVIAGNVRGIQILSLPIASGVDVRGNLIGTAPDGITPRPNTLGIDAATSTEILGIRIGGNELDYRNVISGNDDEGITFTCNAVSDQCFDGAQVQGNLIGLAADGVTALGNGSHGVLLSELSSGIVSIGGEFNNEGNHIAHNGGDGIRATSFSGDARASFLRNAIYANAGLGIDLNGDGRTANDPGDGDSGPNGLQNFPEFLQYLIVDPDDPITVSLEYRIDSQVLVSPSNYPMRVDFYLAEGGQGKVWLGSDVYAEADAQSPRTALVVLPSGVVVNSDDVIVAIATTDTGKSSEFSYYGSETTIISHAPDPSAVGENYTVTVEVASQMPALFNVPGEVAVDDGRGGSCLAALSPISPGLSGGSCILATVGPPGSITLTAAYDDVGQAFTTSSDSVTHQITGALATTTSITLIDPSSTLVGQPYAVSVSVLEGGMPVGVGIVRVTQLNDGAQCLIDLATAATSCNLTGFRALNTAVQARYLGSGSFEASNSAVVGHTVNRADTAIEIVSNTPNPSPAGQPITVTVALPVVAPGAGTPSGEVLITDGIASCAIVLPNLSCDLLPKTSGAVVIEARYLGDANYNPSEATVDHVIVADGADLSIIKRNGLRLLPGGVPSTYVILVSNAGPQDVFNARVTDILPPQLGNASWTCSGSNGGTCPASGSGNVDVLVNLPSGASVTFLLTVTAQIQPEQIVSNIASVMPPANAEDPNLDNNVSIDTDPIGIFGDGHETEDE